jgi:23S rRNA-/tRNA-specific pseudouridylate synthase
MVVRADGKPSRTRLSVQQRFRGFTLLRCEPLTGRTHQLRVHLASSGFPLVVDPIYGRRSALALSEIKAGYRPKAGRAELPLIDRLTLHAAHLEFDALDGSGRRISVEAAPPRDLERALKQFAKVRAPRPPKRA